MSICPTHPAFILVSPAPVDGYPPVQHQARIIADAGYTVELITVPRLTKGRHISFSHSGVSVKVLPLRAGSGINTVARAADFVKAITFARRRYATKGLIEIAYEPLGMLYSDLAPFRPKTRIAHFHEILDTFETSWLQRRLKASIKNYALTVVADATRGEMLSEQLHLGSGPLVVPNYPLATGDRTLFPFAAKGPPFEVVYAGSIGPNQKIDFIINSLEDWPEIARLTLLGELRTDWARDLAASAQSKGLGGRLNFAGWIEYADLANRLSRAQLAISFLDPQIPNWRTAVGASNKRYEYMRAGLSQIGDMNPGVSKLIEGNQIGRCVEEFAPLELANLVREYTDAPHRCAEEGRRAHELHYAEYNYQSSFQPVLEWAFKTFDNLTVREGH